MPRSLRILCLLTALLSGGALDARAGDAAAEHVEQDLPPELKALLLAAQPAWTASTSISGALGYNDNLLLTNDAFGDAQDVADSAFSRLTADALLWHVPKGRIDYYAFANAEYTRFFTEATDANGRVFDDKTAAFAGAEWRFRHEDVFTFTVDGQGYFLDQVFDVSDTDIRRVVADLQVNGVKVWPAIRWAPRPWFWMEGSVAGTREVFRDGWNDARIRDANLTLGWRPGDRFELSVSGTQRRRDFDDHPRYTRTGKIDEDAPGSLVVHEKRVEVQAETRLGADRQWLLRSRVGGLHYLDTGSGYFNYQQRFVSQGVEWSSGHYRIEFDGEAKRREYDVQKIGQGTSLPPVVRDEYTLRVHVERELSERWTLFGEYSWERSRSNDILASYRVNEGLLGARWSWEK